MPGAIYTYKYKATLMVQLFYVQFYASLLETQSHLIKCLVAWNVGTYEFFIRQQLLFEFILCWLCENGNRGPKIPLFGCYAFALQKCVFFHKVLLWNYTRYAIFFMPCCKPFYLHWVYFYGLRIDPRIAIQWLFLWRETSVTLFWKTAMCIILPL